MVNDIKNDKEHGDDKGYKNDSWLVAISFSIISEACPFNGSKMVQTFFFGSELIKNNCFYQMNKNWTMWSMPKCKKDNCPIRVGD